MITMEPRTATRVCSWDSLPNSAYNLYTTDGAAEVAPGVIKPFVADLFRRMDYLAIKELHERIGAADLLNVFEPPVANFLPVFAGRMAVNTAWAEAIVAMWQTPDDAPGPVGQPHAGTDPPATTAGAAGANQVRKRVHSSFWPQCAAAIERNAEKVAAASAKLEASDLTKLSIPALWQRAEALLQMQSHLLANHLGVSGASAEYARLTGKLLASELGDRFDEGMVVALTSGLGEVETLKPALHLWKLGRMVAEIPALATEFERLDVREIRARLAKPVDRDWKLLARHLRAFLADHGHIGEGATDPSQTSWGENPTFVLSVVRTISRSGGDCDPLARSLAAQRARQNLEGELSDMVGRKGRREFLRITGLAQHYARNRERTRACWARAVRLDRPLLLELAGRMASSGSIEKREDFFYLTWDEVGAFVEGAGTPRHAEVAGRRQEVCELENVRPPVAFEAPPAARPIDGRPTATGAVTGLGVSAGVATGRARIVRSISAADELRLEATEVLVAPFTHAGWTPLFVPAAAVVVEAGPSRGHAAMVAREFAMPAVVAARHATRIIRDGDVVTVDGAAGTVTFA